MMAKVVGARELKTRLGSYLREVRRGRTIVVTDRGEPVAEIRPIALARAGHRRPRSPRHARATVEALGGAPASVSSHSAPGIAARHRGRGGPGGSLLIAYLDASALVKRYVEETGSATVRRVLTSPAVTTSRLSEVEIASALARRCREGTLSRHERDRALAAIPRDVASLYVVDLTAEVTRTSLALLARHPLRTGDAIQLASCLYLRLHVADEVQPAGVRHAAQRRRASRGRAALPLS